MVLRRQLHKLGLRYQVDRAVLPTQRRRADIVFRSARVVVFVDGCFWHNCDVHGTMPKSNADWWRAKLDANRNRDIDTDRQLTSAGWTVIRVWEHEDIRQAVEGICRLVKRPATPRALHRSADAPFER